MRRGCLTLDQHADNQLEKICITIKTEKTRKGLNQTELGQLMGYSQQQMSKHLGQRLTLKDFVMLVQILDIDDATILKMIKTK